MALKQINPIWLLPVGSRSPLEGLESLKPGLRLALISGEKDTVAPPVLTQDFARNARAIGVQATLKILPGAGHNILLDRQVLAELVSLQTRH